MRDFTNLLDFVPDGALYLVDGRKEAGDALAYFRHKERRVQVEIAWKCGSDEVRGHQYTAVVLAPGSCATDVSHPDIILSRVRRAPA